VRELIESLLSPFGARRDVSLAELTTLGIGGIAKWLVDARDADTLVQLVVTLDSFHIPFRVIGAGSNIVAPDEGYEGVLVRNAIRGVTIEAHRAYVGGGHGLHDLIRTVNAAGLGGIERMAGIPGTVAGAIYGNAGAYGQEVKDRMSVAQAWDGEMIRAVTNVETEFGYRTSVYKRRKQWFVLSACFALDETDPAPLEKTSAEIVQKRTRKYPPDLRCPGSFFKNILLEELSRSEAADLRAQVPEEKIIAGKVPAGHLLEQVGALGMQRGGIRIADYHGNLFYNAGGGTCADVRALAAELADRVEDRFGYRLEEEVQYL